jgi:cell surface hyaluronidase
MGYLKGSKPSLPMRGTLPILLVLLAATPIRGADLVAVASGNWSSPATWGGTLPAAEDDVSIPSGLSVVLDADVECGAIVVSGVLEVQRADRTLLCDSLLVQGAGSEFRVGAANDRFTQNFILTLKGLPTETTMASMGAKILGAHNGGTLNIHGRDRVEWTKLGAHANPGATSMTLATPVDWAVGDTILVTSSRLSWTEAETRTITAVNGNTVSFTQPLAFFHCGNTLTKTRSTDGKSWTADLRAEVGLLSRNIRIEGDAASETAGFGGHIMVMNGGSACCATSGRAFIQGAELFRMGQKGIVGRYPMHWHMCAEDGAGQYFKDNVVRRSFNRAITIHGTESTLVDNNFCHDHLGHGIFLEDGSERFNVITRNVVLSSMRPAAGEEILQTDNFFNAVQNRSPASFWITNPNNIFTDNIAAGTHGTGFWFAFPKKPLNLSLTHPRFIGLEPYKQPLGQFDRNVAHSCANGLDINDQVDANDELVINGEWANNGPFFFNDCTFYSNDVAIYAGIGGTRKNVVYYNNVFSDNETNLFLATYHLCEQSLMVADSGFGIMPSSKSRTMYAIYDGAGRMKDNHLVGYHASNTRLFDNIGAATKRPNHRFEGFTLDPPIIPRSSLTNYNIVPPADVGVNSAGHPRIWAQVIHDVDGSLCGVPDSSIISNQPFLRTGVETRPANWTNMYRSGNRFAQCRMTYGIASADNPNISVIRSKPGTPNAGVYYINGYKEQHQLPLIVKQDFLYSYHYESLPSSRKVFITMNDASVGDHFLIRFKDFGKLPGISITGMTSSPSLDALKASSVSSYYKETNGDYYIRPLATAGSQSYTLSWTSQITMPMVDSDNDGTSDGAEAAAGTDPFRTADATDPFPASEFVMSGNFEEWVSLTGLTGETVSAGALNATASNNDPQMFLNNLKVAGNSVPWILVRMRVSQNTSPLFYWTRVGGTSYTTARLMTASYSGNNSFRVVAFPMGTHAEWQNRTITGLRFDPTGTNGTNFSIDWMRASNGDLDGDTLSDRLEGDGDDDQDGLVNLEDTDSDGDGIPDAQDPEPYHNPFDTDQDGTPDILDSDDDNDGTPDPADAFPLDPSEQSDSDNDGIGDNADAFPLNPAEQTDTDGDGIGNNADPDDDGDGASDSLELAATRNPVDPMDLNFGFNTDGNFEGWNNRSGFTSDPAPEVSGGTMKGRSTPSGDPYFWRTGFSLDGDRVNQIVVKIKTSTGSGSVELFWARTGEGSSFSQSRRVSTPTGPANVWKLVYLNPSRHAGWMGNTIGAIRIDPTTVADRTFEVDWIRVSNGDLDQDGIPDTTEGNGDVDGDGLLNAEDLDSDGDLVPDSVDPQPYVNGLIDFDNDGIPDATDEDDDNDGATDASDAFPFDANEQLDSDGDGIGNQADADDDNDGTPDHGDAFPLNPAEQLDNDNDGIGNHADPDDDNDAFTDELDAFPFDLDEHLDSDLDGIGNHADPDDDNDGLPDVIESAIGLSEILPIDPMADSDGDGQTDLLEAHAGTNRLDASDRFHWLVTRTKITLNVKPGRTYRILASDSLSPPQWQVVETIHPDALGDHEYVDLTLRTSRFYKVAIAVDMP